MEIALSIDKNIISPTEKTDFAATVSLFSVTGFRPENWRRMEVQQDKERNWN